MQLYLLHPVALFSLWGQTPLFPHKQLFSITSANDIRPSVTKDLLNSLCQIADIGSIQLLNKQVPEFTCWNAKITMTTLEADPEISSTSLESLNFQYSRLKLTLAVIFHFFQSH